MVSKLLKVVPVALVALVASLFGAGIAHAATPASIEGTWAFAGGQVNVQPGTSPGTYVGTVTQNTKFANGEQCSHTAGSVIWQISAVAGSTTSYSGTNQWLNPSQGCTGTGLADGGQGQALWNVTVSGSTATLQFCTRKPGDGPASTTPDNKTDYCFGLSQTVAPTAEPSVPANSAPPTISGTPAVGQTLSCSTGTWSNAPTGYAYSWQRDGGSIAGATQATYVTQSADAGHSITCTVVATNNGGVSQGARSAGVQVTTSSTPVTKTKSGCPAATGALSAKGIGTIKLGMTRAAARHAYRTSHDRRSKFRDLFCLTHKGLQVGYGTPALRTAILKTDPARNGATKAIKRATGHVVWVTTANPHYALHGVRPGTKLSTARKHLKLGKAYHVHGKSWYLILKKGSSTGLVKVSHGKVTEVGLARRPFTTHPFELTALLNGLV